jgi:hypothetical protein
VLELLNPPAMSTLPLGSSVAVPAARPIVMLAAPELRKVLLTQSYSSVLAS